MSKPKSYTNDVLPVLITIPLNELTPAALMQRLSFETTKQQVSRWVNRFCKDRGVTQTSTELLVAELLERKGWSLNVSPTKVGEAIGVDRGTARRALNKMKALLGETK